MTFMVSVRRSFPFSFSTAGNTVTSLAIAGEGGGYAEENEAQNVNTYRETTSNCLPVSPPFVLMSPITLGIRCPLFDAGPTPILMMFRSVVVPLCVLVLRGLDFQVILVVLVIGLNITPAERNRHTISQREIQRYRTCSPLRHREFLHGKGTSEMNLDCCALFETFKRFSNIPCRRLELTSLARSRPLQNRTSYRTASRNGPFNTGRKKTTPHRSTRFRRSVPGLRFLLRMAGSHSIPIVDILI